MTKNSTDLPWEDNFNEEDAISFNNGVYTFQHPLRFTSNPSQKKQIGLRRIRVTPRSADLNLNIAITKIENGIPKTQAEGTLHAHYTDEDKLPAILKMLEGSFVQKDTEQPDYTLRFEYDDIKREVAVYAEDGVEMYGIDMLSESNEEDLIDLAYLFNKEFNTEFRDMLTGYMNHEYVLITDVWDRDVGNIYIHSSFSDQKRQFMAMNFDQQKEISIMFTHHGSDEFHIWFTLLGKKRIILNGVDILLQLCYICNYDDSAVL